MISVRYGVGADRAGLGHLLQNAGWPSAATSIGDHPWPWPILVALDDGEVVGMLQGRFDQRYDESWCPAEHEGPQAWVFDLVVAPGRRGEGIGSGLITKFANEARVNGCSYLALRVSPIGGQSEVLARQAFFERNGFAPVPQGEEYDVFGFSL